MTENGSMVIINYFKSLDDKAKADFRSKAMDATGMGYATFYNKIRGDFSFTKAEITVITSLIPIEDAAEH